MNEKMRIGILTLPLHTNYGGILQAYALQTVLERMGHDVKVLDKPFKPQLLPWWKRPYSYTKRAIKKYILGEKVGIFQERNAYQRQATERKFTQPFIESNIHRLVISHLTDIKPSDFDAFVVGSDQIWRMMYFNGFWSTPLASDAFLGFTEGWNIKRVSYAASFGVDVPDIPEKDLDDCKKAIARFNGISVREESGVAACKKYLGVEAKWVLDQTMLLKRSDYQKLISKTPNPKPILMSYVLDETPEIAALRSKIAKDKGLQIKLTNLPNTGTGERGISPINKMVHPRIALVESFNPSSSKLKYSSSLNPYAFRFITFILLLMPSRVALVTCASYHAKIPVRFAISVLATFINGFSFVSLALSHQ